MAIIAYWVVVALLVLGTVWFSGYNRRKIEKLEEENNDKNTLTSPNETTNICTLRIEDRIDWEKYYIKVIATEPKWVKVKKPGFYSAYLWWPCVLNAIGIFSLVFILHNTNWRFFVGMIATQFIFAAGQLTGRRQEKQKHATL